MKKRNKVQIFLNILVLTSGILSYISWLDYEGIESIGVGLWSAFYKTVQTFLFSASFETYPIPLLLKITALVAPLSMAGSILYKVISFIRIKMIGFLINSFSRGHIVIMGSPEFCRSILIRGKDVDKRKVLLLPQGNEDAIRHLVDRRVHPICGDIELTNTWIDAGLRYADNLIMAPGFYDHLDEIKLAIEPILNRRKSTLEINYALEHYNQKEVFADNTTWFSSDKMDAHSFHVINMAASVIVEKYAPHNFTNVDRLQERAPHIILDGFNELASWVIFEAAQLYHYPSFDKLKISVIINDRSELVNLFNFCPALLDVIDLEVLYEDQIIQKFNNGDSSIFSGDLFEPDIILCFHNDPWIIPKRARMWRRFLLLNSKEKKTPLVFFLPQQCENADTFRSMSENWSNLDFSVHSPKEFISLNRILENREVIDSIAQEIHRNYQVRYNAKDWLLLSDREKDFNRRTARHLKIKLNLIGYDLTDTDDMVSVPLPNFSDNEISMLARLEHRRWVAEKLLDGYIFGEFPEDSEMKNYYKNSLRIHQDIRPFNELNEEDIDKDRNTFEDLKQILLQVLEKKTLVYWKK